MTIEFVSELPAGYVEGIVLLEDGTASVPALRFENDLDTGLFRKSENALNFTTGGVERVEVNSNDTTFYQRAREQSFYNNSYYCTIREGLPLIKDRQTIIEMLTNWVNPYTVSAGVLKPWNTICYSEELDIFVACGSSASNNYTYSQDGGVNWISSTLPASVSITCVKYVGGLFLALHITGVNTYWSTNGISGWTSATGTTGANRDVIYLSSYNRWLICNATTTPFILQSSDGKAYTSVGITQPSCNGLLNMAFSPELNVLVAVGTASGGGNNLHYSRDGGLTWTTIGVVNNTLRNVIWVKELNQFICVGNAERYYYSFDGINWSNTGVSIPASSPQRDLSNILWIDDLHAFVMSSQTTTGDPELYYSFDGRIYSSVNISGDRPIETNGICYSHRHGSIHWVVSASGSSNRERFAMSRLSNRVPTSHNIFSHPFNQISDLGNWYMKEGGIWIQFTSSVLTYAPSAREYRYFTLELDNVAHANNATFTLPAMSDGDSYIVQCYCGPLTSANRQIILSNNTGFGIWDARTRTTTANGSTVVIFQAVGGVNCANTFLFTKFQGGNVHMIEIGDKTNQANIGPVILAGGSQSAPSLTFTGDTNTGLYWQSDGEFRMSCNGILNTVYTSTFINSAVPLRAPNGTAGAPSLSFVNDTDSGLYTDLTNVVLSVGGGNKVLVDGTRLQADCVIRGQSGSVSAPMYSFTSDINTGIYNPVADRIAFSCGGVECANIDANTTYFRNQINIPDGTASVPALIFNSNQNYGIYCVSASDEINFRIAGTTYHKYSTTTSEIPSQLKTRSIVNNLLKTTTGANYTITRLNSLIYGHFTFDISAPITVNLPNDLTSADIGLTLTISKMNGAHQLTISPQTGNYLNNILSNTYVLANTDYRWVNCILVDVVSNVEYWLVQH